MCHKGASELGAWLVVGTRDVKVNNNFQLHAASLHTARHMFTVQEIRAQLNTGDFKKNASEFKNKIKGLTLASAWKRHVYMSFIYQ